jgi:hypothetical protein
MSRRWFLFAMLPVGALAVAATPAAGQKPAEPVPANKENIDAALKLTLAAAAEYEFRVGTDEKEKPLELVREPVLKWSNPDRGEVHGNVFVWTREGRPLVVGSLYKWFTPHTHMSHEFLSLAQGPLAAKFHGQEVWKTDESVVRFADVPGAPAPADTEAQRLLQMKQLAKDFSGSKKERDEKTGVIELRLLPQPIHRYAAPKQGVVSGGLFALVHGTDPELFVLIEARGKKDEPVPKAPGESPKKDVDGARWQYAATRMTSSEVRLRHRDKEVWSGEIVPWKDVSSHERAYTSFLFKEIPDFLKDAVAKPKQ